MLKITIPADEQWDERKQEFIDIQECTLLLEHSLISLSKWEAKWCKAFLGKQEKTNEEIIDYIKCMTLTPNINPEIYNHLTSKNIMQINEYINSPMTATHIYNNKRSGNNRETITSELIYCWMVMLNIPFECQKWHLNRLITLIEVINIKSQPPKHMSRKEIINRNAALNAARRQKLNTKG